MIPFEDGGQEEPHECRPAVNAAMGALTGVAGSPFTEGVGFEGIANVRIAQ
jgi:hypothetical protein